MGYDSEAEDAKERDVIINRKGEREGGGKGFSNAAPKGGG